MERNNFICAPHIISMRPAIDSKLNSVGYTFIIISSLPIVRCIWTLCLSHSLQLQFENNWKPRRLWTESKKKQQRRKWFAISSDVRHKQKANRPSECMYRKLLSHSLLSFDLNSFLSLFSSSSRSASRFVAVPNLRTNNENSLSFPSLPLFLFLSLAIAVFCRKFIMVFVLAWLTCRMAFAVSFCRHIVVDLLRTACHERRGDISQSSSILSLWNRTAIDSLHSVFLHSLCAPMRRQQCNAIAPLLWCDLKYIQNVPCDACTRTCAARSFGWERNCEIGSFPLCMVFSPIIRRRLETCDYDVDDVGRKKIETIEVIVEKRERLEICIRAKMVQ